MSLRRPGATVEASQANRRNGSTSGTFKMRSCGLRHGQFLERHGRHFDVQVDSIQQWAGDLREVSLNYGSGTAAFAGRVADEATRASVQVTTATFRAATVFERRLRTSAQYARLVGSANIPGARD
jgi:hypothetical protein